ASCDGALWGMWDPPMALKTVDSLDNPAARPTPIGFRPVLPPTPGGGLVGGEWPRMTAIPLVAGGGGEKTISGDGSEGEDWLEGPSRIEGTGKSDFEGDPVKGDYRLKDGPEIVKIVTVESRSGGVSHGTGDP